MKYGKEMFEWLKNWAFKQYPNDWECPEVVCKSIFGLVMCMPLWDYVNNKLSKVEVEK